MRIAAAGLAALFAVCVHARPQSIKATYNGYVNGMHAGVITEQFESEAGNYRLQVDRQTKAFYLTEEAAQAAGLVIKKGHPVVQVSIYNSAEGVNKIIELPK